MNVAVVREILKGERRVALVPESCAKLAKAGMAVLVESGAGDAAFFSDDAYRRAGARVEQGPGAVLGGADLVLKVQPPSFNPAVGLHEADMMRPDALLVGQLVPARHPEAVAKLAERGITAFAMDRIPRITRAQPMDTLSSMANIAGYRAVLLAADLLPRFFPMMTTAAGTVLPAKVLVILSLIHI